MTLTPGARLGPYRIVSTLGAGGMGEVYRAEDTRLDRQVAIKILGTGFTADPDHAARFRREARTLASLNHPNIGAIHGLEEADGVTALVLELIDGEDLAARVARGPLPVDEAFRIAAQVAAALEAAHAQGIIHRDLKPANIRLRADGTVKVVDFGLARGVERANAAAAPSAIVTSPAMTDAGVILGTAAYMSPEQARGQPLDQRTDVWAFGCVLYELLTGRRTFTGASASDLFAAILTQTPDLAALPSSVPPSARRLIRRCLEKDRGERLRDMGDARIEIRDVLAGVEPDVVVGVAQAPRPSLRERLIWIGTAGVLAAALSATWASSRSGGAGLEETRAEITTPPSAAPTAIAIAPDGRSVAFVATSEGVSRLWLRSLASGVATPLVGSEGADAPFWSPDGKSIGFFAEQRLRRIEVAGGSAQTIAAVPRGTGGTWSRDNVILVAGLGIPISQLPATGGPAVPVPVPGLARTGSDFAPYFLPDGRHFLYYVRGAPEVRGVYLAQLDGKGNPRRLSDADGGAVYAKSGFLLFVLRGALYARRLDASSFEVTGDPMRLTGEVAGDREETALSISDTGTIAYRVSAAFAAKHFAWFDRTGRELERPALSQADSLSQPALAPDGGRVAVYQDLIGGNVDIWIFDLRRGAWTRFTSDPADDVFPVWSPDGARLAFASNRTGVHDLYVKSANGGGSEELVLSTPQWKSPTDWSPDGRFLLFNLDDPKHGRDIWAVEMGGAHEPFAVVQTMFDEQSGQFSPDGRWIAFQSNESGRLEIYVQPFPGPAQPQPISTDGGGQPRWSRNGRELFYVAANGQLMVVRVRPRSSSGPIDMEPPSPLFAPPFGGGVPGDVRHQYMLSPDGQRILITSRGDTKTSPISLILNWTPRG